MIEDKMIEDKVPLNIETEEQNPAFEHIPTPALIKELFLRGNIHELSMRKAVSLQYIKDCKDRDFPVTDELITSILEKLIRYIKITRENSPVEYAVEFTASISVIADTIPVTVGDNNG